MIPQIIRLIIVVLALANFHHVRLAVLNAFLDISVANKVKCLPIGNVTARVLEQQAKNLKYHVVAAMKRVRIDINHPSANTWPIPCY